LARVSIAYTSIESAASNVQKFGKASVTRYAVFGRDRTFKKYSQGRQVRRSTVKARATAFADQVIKRGDDFRAGRQPEDCQGARIDDTAAGARRADEVIE
jgi:hypothetical protein